MQNEKISVLIPVYNVENYLVRCIKSVLTQTHINLELILTNDESTDASAAICDEFALKDERIKVLHLPHGGLAAMRNAGLQAASGKYILFADSDDWLAPDMLETLHKALLNNDADIAECGYEHVFKDAFMCEIIKNGELFITDGNGAVEDMLENRIFRSIVCCKLIRRSITKGIEFPANKLHEDEFTVHHFYFAAKKVVFVDVAKYYYDRTREAAITSETFTTRRLDGCEALHQRMHLVWAQKLASMEEKMNNRYSYVLFYRLNECYTRGMNDEKVQETVVTALQNRAQMLKENRQLNKKYIPLYDALAKGLPQMCAAWKDKGWEE